MKQRASVFSLSFNDFQNAEQPKLMMCKVYDPEREGIGFYNVLTR